MALTETIADAVKSAKDLFLPDDEAASPRPAAGGHADAVELLEEDHRKVAALFEEILRDPSSALTSQRKKIATVLAELALHAKIEETIVYPAVYAKTKRDTAERLEVLEAVEEHAAMKDLMKKIARSSGRDETLKAKVRVLSEIVDHHVREEESTFFPEAEKLLGKKRLAEIGTEIVKIKARAARRTAPKARRVAEGTAKKTSRNT